MAELHEYKETPGKCAACGNSPVNHQITYVFNTLNVVFSELSYRVRDSRILHALEYGARWFMEWLDASQIWLWSLAGAVKFGTDPSKARTYRSQVIWEEAVRRGVYMEQIFLFGTPTDIYRARIGNDLVMFKSIPVPPQLPQDAYLWIDDKFLLKKELAILGVPAPATRSVTSLKAARAAFREIGAPVVVKPRSGSRGRHTTIGVRTETDLETAFKSAKMLGFFVSIEKHLDGPVCRATLVGGTLAGFFEAVPPQLVGDGVLTISQLVAQTNAARPDRVQEIVLTEEVREYLSRQGLGEDSVPEKGAKVLLTHRTGRLFGGATRELLDTVHPKLRAYLEKAGKGLAAPVVGFDLIIPKPEEDPDTQKWGIIEANSLPFIDLHYLPLYGKPSNPAAKVWDLWSFDTASKPL